MAHNSPSIVIVNHNAGAWLGRCVESVLSGSDQVVVVDNASSDGSLESLGRLSPPEGRLEVIRLQSNVGFAAACNLGIGVSKGTSLLFLNPDCQLGEGSLRRMQEVLDSDSAVGMVGGLLVNEDGSEQGGGRRAVPTPWRSFVRAFGLYRLQHRWPRMFFDFYLHKQPLPANPIEVEAISGACMLVKREAMEDVGPWDEGYFLHVEDLDWCMRFQQKGWKIKFVPHAPVLHVLGACGRRRPVFVEWHKHKGMLRFYRKFFRHQYPGVLMGLVTVGVWLRFGLVAGWKTVSRIGGKREQGLGK